MVDDSVRGFWAQVADLLRDRISGQDWCSWFAGARAIELGAERIVVEVVNDFAARWVEDRFRGVLEDTVAQVAGVPLEVAIVAAGTAQVDPPAAAGDTGAEDAAATQPHEDLARAARAHVRSMAASAPGAGDVMTSEQLRAELAASDLQQIRRKSLWPFRRQSPRSVCPEPT